MAYFEGTGFITPRIAMVDAFGWRSKRTTSSFLAIGKDIAIFDPAGSNSADLIINELKNLGIEMNNVKYIFVSHRHNDHSAGASVLVKKLKNAMIYAHQITLDNLINPEKINEATLSMYGYLAEPIEPVKEKEKLIPIKDNDTFDLGNGVSIRALYQPGHTSDHFMFFEEGNKFLFAGDGAGLYSGKYKTLLPNSFPPSFKYNEYLKSFNRVIELNPNILGFSHFGALSEGDVKNVLNGGLKILQEWKRIIETEPNYEDEIIKNYGSRFDLFSEDFRKEVLKIIISGFRKNL